MKLSSQTLATLEPREAAARFVVRRSEGLTRDEESVLEKWLAADIAHLDALDDAEFAWRALDDAGDNEFLAPMRARAAAARPRPGFGLGAAVAAVLVVLTTAALLAGAASGVRPSPRLRRARKRA